METKLLDTHRSDLDSLSATAKLILELVPGNRVFFFKAQMGAGKTTLIKEMCVQLGSRDNFSSPSYSIINEYGSQKGNIYHIDLYRIKNIVELIDLGLDDILHSGNYCFIEWPDLIENYTDVNHVNISMELKDNIRYISASKIEP